MAPTSGTRRAASAVTPAAFERRLPSIAGLAHAAELSQVPLLPEEHQVAARISFPKAGSIRICSRWTCASATRGGC